MCKLRKQHCGHCWRWWIHAYRMYVMRDGLRGWEMAREASAGVRSRRRSNLGPAQSQESGQSSQSQPFHFAPCGFTSSMHRHSTAICFSRRGSTWSLRSTKVKNRDSRREIRPVGSSRGSSMRPALRNCASVMLATCPHARAIVRGRFNLPTQAQVINRTSKRDAAKRKAFLYDGLATFRRASRCDGAYERIGNCWRRAWPAVSTAPRILTLQR